MPTFFSYFSRERLLMILFATLMAIVVLTANIVLRYNYRDLFTWGSFVYPFVYLVLDLTNRSLGPKRARQVVYVGLTVAIACSFVWAGVRIAIAAGIANAVSQLLDVFVFDQLRQARWWHAPLISSILAAIIDSYFFFSLAFVGTTTPWLLWATNNLI